MIGKQDKEYFKNLSESNRDGSSEEVVFAKTKNKKVNDTAQQKIINGNKTKTEENLDSLDELDKEKEDFKSDSNEDNT